MAWIESHQDLRDHPKVLALGCSMGWDLDTTIGKLHRFWWWCLSFAVSGDLSRYNDGQLASAVGLNAEDGQRFIEAMVTCGGEDHSGFINRKPYFRVHDWWDYAGKFLQIKYKHYPEKWQEIRDLYYPPQNGSKKGSKNHKPTDLTDLTKPTINIEGVEISDEAWMGFLEMRAQKKALPTTRAIKNIGKKLEQFYQKHGHRPDDVLDQSTNNNWTDVYPIKSQHSSKKGEGYFDS